jgi:hypothetical protein
MKWQKYKAMWQPSGTSPWRQREVKCNKSSPRVQQATAGRKWSQS